MKKPILPSGGGSFIRAADGRLTKQEPSTTVPAKTKVAKSAGAVVTKKKGG